MRPCLIVLQPDITYHEASTWTGRLVVTCEGAMQQTTIAKIENQVLVTTSAFRLDLLEFLGRLEAALDRWRTALEDDRPSAEPESRDSARELNGKLEIRLPE